MKKLIVLALVLSLCVAAFAQPGPPPGGLPPLPSVKVGIKLEGGVVAYNNSEDTVFMSKHLAEIGFSADAGNVGVAAKLEVTAEGQDMTYAVAPATGDDWLPLLKSGYAWFKFFNGMVQLDLGRFFNPVEYRLDNKDGGDVAGKFFNKETGLLLHVRPVKGLSVAAFVPTQAKWIATPGPDAARYTGTQLLEDAFKNLDLLAKYSVDGIGTFYAAYEMVDTAGNAPAPGPGAPPAKNVLSIGARITAVPVVGIKVGFIDKMYDDVSDMSIMLSGEATFGALQVWEDAYLMLPIEDTVNVGAEKAFGWKSATEVSYGLSKEAFLGFKLKVENGRLTSDDYVAIAVKPSFTYKFAPMKELTVAFEYKTENSVGATRENVWFLPITYKVEF